MCNGTQVEAPGWGLYWVMCFAHAVRELFVGLRRTGVRPGPELGLSLSGFFRRCGVVEVLLSHEVDTGSLEILEILSCLVLSCLVLSCLVLSCLVL